MTVRPDAIEELSGVGPALAEKLARLHIATLSDLLFHLPLRYEDRTHRLPLDQLQAQQPALFEGIIQDSLIQQGRRLSLLVRVRDERGEVGLRFYYFTSRQRAAFRPGHAIQCFGEPRRGASGLEVYHPEYRIRATPQELPPPAGTLTPVYPTTEGLPQKTLRKLVAQAMQWLRKGGELAEYLPESLLRQSGLPTLSEALAFIHQPEQGTDRSALTDGRHPAVVRLVLEELLAQHLAMQRVRQHARREPAPALDQPSVSQDRLLANLPFSLTNAQARVVQEVDADLAGTEPMLRLVQGDVGSGKTLVAVLAMLRAIDNGYQAVFMAPTEILAEQHARNLEAWLEPMGIPVALALGRHTRRRKADVLAGIAAGAPCIVGTHALFQTDVRFQRVGLVVVDEQHRFGVGQRLALREKGRFGAEVPHQLIMTATPIPRTLAMSLYADLDVSVIDELPPGRKPVHTSVLSDAERERVMARVHTACAEGRQVYWVCTLIEDSEELQAQAAEDLYAQLIEQMRPYRVGLVHGRLKPAGKAAIMTEFKEGRVDVLVATTVIEVGLDVPNASIMVIENSERLGLSQLHQLRGRVGRGATESFCILLYRPPLSQQGKARLNTMRSTGDGFRIAEQDLLLRGPGEVLGTRQTGLAGLRVADLQRDQAWLPVVRELSDTMLRTSPKQVEALLRRWHPSGLDYGNV